MAAGHNMRSHSSAILVNIGLTVCTLFTGCGMDSVLIMPPLFCLGMHLEKWLRVNKDSLDLRDRQLVLQQVINFLAALHTVGSHDKLCLWGSFVGKSGGHGGVYILGGHVQ